MGNKVKVAILRTPKNHEEINKIISEGIEGKYYGCDEYALSSFNNWGTRVCDKEYLPSDFIITDSAEVFRAACEGRELNKIDPIESKKEEAPEEECKSNCGMNYCDDNGCIERKRNLTGNIIMPEEEANTAPKEWPLNTWLYSNSELRNLLEDVVNELDLSSIAIEEHGPLGTEPSKLVRLVLDQKGKEIQMLKAGINPVEVVEPKQDMFTQEEYLQMINILDVHNSYVASAVTPYPFKELRNKLKSLIQPEPVPPVAGNIYSYNEHVGYAAYGFDSWHLNTSAYGSSKICYIPKQDWHKLVQLKPVK